MKKNVGIITIHDSTNCGAILQAYALQECIKACNCSVEIINHKGFLSSSNNKEKRKISFKFLFKYLLFLLKQPRVFYALVFGRKITSNDTFKRKCACNEFRKERMTIGTKEYCSEISLNENPPMYDVYICGSDQIWSPERITYAQSFFLSFVRDGSVKASYAPSLGVEDIPEQYSNLYKDLLADFGFISTREKKSKEILEKLLNREVECVLDPTLLLSKQEWASRLGIDAEQNHEKYLFCYFLNHINLAKSRDIINQVAKSCSCKVLVAKPGYSKMDKDWIPALSVGPMEFLRLLYNAEYIFTDSFHGTAFSINFNKDFSVYDDSNESIFKSRFGRIKNILSILDIEECAYCSNKVFHKQDIDYLAVNNRLISEREKSLKYLEKVLS